MEQREKTEVFESFGHNIEIHVYFLRHAPGDKKTGDLTIEGVEIAKKYGEDFEPSSEGETYLVKSYSSEIDRANQTAETIINSVESNRKGHTRIRFDLGEKEEDFRIPIESLKMPYTDYLKVCRKEEKIGEKMISLHDLAKRVALQLDHFIKLSEKLKNNSVVDLLNITHIPWIPAFLKEILKEESDELDLSVDYTEGFEFVIKRDADAVSLVMKFKDKEFVIKSDDLEKITI